MDNSPMMISTAGICVYNGSTWLFSNNGNCHITKYYIDSLDDVWLVSDGPVNIRSSVAGAKQDKGVISKYDGKNLTFWTKDQLQIKSTDLVNFYETSNRDIWITWAASAKQMYGGGLLGNAIGNAITEASRRKGLLQYSNGRWINHHDDLPNSEGLVGSIFETADKRVWFLTTDNTLFYFEDGRFFNAKKTAFNNGILSNTYPGGIGGKRTFIDSKRNLWLNLGPNVAMYNNENWKTFHGLDGIIYETKDQSIVLVGVEGRKDNLVINKFNGVDDWKYVEVGEAKHPSKVKNNYNILSTKEDSAKNIWILVRGNLGVYDGNRYNWEMEDKDLKILFIDKESRVWVAGNKGVYLKESGAWKYNDSINNVKEFLEDNKGMVWLATDKDGVMSYKDGNWQKYSEQNGLLSSTIIQIYLCRSNTFWVTTDKGLCKFN